METGSSFTGTSQKNYGRAMQTDRLRCSLDGLTCKTCSQNCSCRCLGGRASLLPPATAAATSLDAVDFDQADAGGVIFATHDRCPVSLNECGQNGRFTIIAGRK